MKAPTHFTQTQDAIWSIRMAGRLCRVAIVILSLAFAGTAVAEAITQFVYFGARTPPAKGIYVSRFDTETGVLGEPQIAGEIANATYITRHPWLPVIYAAGNAPAGGAQPTGGIIAAFQINSENGALTLINQVGDGPTNGTYVSIMPDGRTALTAHYTGGYASSFPMREDGSLGECATLVKHTLAGDGTVPQQNDPHPHCINPTPGGERAIVADLSADHLFSYRITKNSELADGQIVTAVAPGSGVRHIAFAPDARHLYAINEIASTVVVFDYYTATGAVHESQTISTVPQGFKGRRWASEIAVHPGGKFLYVSNRPDDNTLVVFSINPQDGKLAEIQRVPGFAHPRQFALSADGRWLICSNQDSNEAVSYRINVQTGKLSGPVSRIAVPQCVCVLFSPSAPAGAPAPTGSSVLSK